MRGLTNEERAELSLAASTSVNAPISHYDAVDSLKARGLLSGSFDPDTWDIVYVANADGLLALRLDAAARQLEGVSV